jgi:hypothetical protein
MTFTVNKEFCEIPFDICFVTEFLVIHVCELIESSVLQAFAETLERLFCCQIGKQRVSCLSVNIDFLELRKLCSELKCAELVDSFIVFRCLVGKLVAWEVTSMEHVKKQLSH